MSVFSSVLNYVLTVLEIGIPSLLANNTVAAAELSTVKPLILIKEYFMSRNYFWLLKLG